MFRGGGCGGGGRVGVGDNGDYDNAAASVIVCAWELIAVMQAASRGRRLEDGSKRVMTHFSLHVAQQRRPPPPPPATRCSADNH